MFQQLHDTGRRPTFHPITSTYITVQLENTQTQTQTQKNRTNVNTTHTRIRTPPANAPAQMPMQT